MLIAHGSQGRVPPSGDGTSCQNARLPTLYSSAAWHGIEGVSSCSVETRAFGNVLPSLSEVHSARVHAMTLPKQACLSL